MALPSQKGQAGHLQSHSKAWSKGKMTDASSGDEPEEIEDDSHIPCYPCPGNKGQQTPQLQMNQCNQG